ncbi:MAG: InlB B-repeat-containing protein [Candidatus Enteromonas sp.]|nr:InlB B-repeat-containing protein [Candidatus Enteromonas sp.]
MNKKPIVLSILAIAMLLTACGGDSAPSSRSEVNETGSQESSKVVPSEESSLDTSISTEESKARYLITFKDEEGSVLEAKEWEEGSTPSYSYSKEDNQEWDYTFHGWSSTLGGEVITIPEVTAEATYYAVVTKVKQRYTITFISNGGSEVSPITEEYGTEIQEPAKPTYEKHKFVAWSFDEGGEEKVTWPLVLTKNETLYANWNETVEIKAYLSSLVSAVKQDPYSFIPETMLPTNSDNHVTEQDVTYDFTSSVNVSNIRYGGYGEQWNMVIGNIIESERFYSILSLAETAVNASVIAFNNYLDANPSDSASHQLSETEYTASLDYHNGILTYILQYKTGWNVPFFGEILPQIDMTYNVMSGERSVRVQLTENNVMRYVVKEGSYAFAIQYGVSALSRKAYFQIDRRNDGSVDGHIYEFIQYKDSDMVPSCADFYIGEEYVSVVGNKASGMPGFTGYINELYKTEEGKLLGYEVRETFSKWGITATYHTLWFNLCDISGITSVKAIKNDSNSFGLGGNNAHDIYLNGSSSVFEPTYNKKLTIQTSRKYDVEMRKQSFFGYVEDVLTEYQVQIPMMFIQADHDGYTNFSDFPSDILSKSGISARVNMPSAVLNKIQSDYATLVDVFIVNKENVTGETIEAYIGTAASVE